MNLTEMTLSKPNLYMSICMFSFWAIVNPRISKYLAAHAESYERIRDAVERYGTEGEQRAVSNDLSLLLFM